MPKAKPDRRKALRQKVACDSAWLFKTTCGADRRDICRPVRKEKAIVTRDAARDLAIQGLRQKMAMQQKLLDMLLVLVDPEDVRAAFELPQITPSHETLTRIADETVLPPEFFDEA